MSLNPRIEDWRGRTAWIVGASSGIGRATAAALHALGARVVVSSRDAAALDTFVAEHAGAIALPLDVTRRDDVAAAAAALPAAPDLVCFCAGRYLPMQAMDFDVDEAVRQARVNYEGALNVLAVALPTMLERGGGHVCLVSSVAGFRGLPRGLAYGPTKAALINLAESLHLDLAPRGVGVSVVTPGFVATPMTARNEFPMPAIVSADDAAREIVRGWKRGDFHIHFPRRFTRAMKLLRLLPYALYFAAVHRFTGL
jgi:NAD(P)-dependent dehydrogenase (short-subunit alcohol dehydrogenase family)